jgi:hypothetical protein
MFSNMRRAAPWGPHGLAPEFNGATFGFPIALPSPGDGAIPNGVGVGPRNWPVTTIHRSIFA